MSAVDDLPFLCDACGERFGFGDSQRQNMLAVVSSMPFSDEPTPCCGVLISGTLVRGADGYAELVMT